MGIGVLGTLTVDDAPVSLSPRDRVVLSALATRPGQVVSRDALGEALWRGDPPASSAKVLQGCVSRIRRLLGTGAVQTAPPGYRLTVPQESLDSVRFERTIGRARDLAALGQADRAAHLVDEALSLWRGRPFPDVEEWEPGVVEAGRLEEVRREAEELRIDCYLRAGRHHEVLADAAALVREGPTREARWALLARAQYQDGRQAEALATVQQARDLLAGRLGLDPGPELARLHEAMLRQDSSLMPDVTRRARSAAECPYRGLAAYDVGDAESFFGRDHEVAACLDLLQQHGVLAVVGPSGSGKSSVVRAGVAAALARGGTRVHVITPGETPDRVLEALPRRSGRDALVVDQCEEVFSLCADEEQRRAFLDRLVAHAEKAPLVVALRADRLADVAPYPSFARVVEKGLHLLGAMDETSLREAIETPARQTGLILEPGLVDLLLREVEGEPGALPLLSHALQETWLRREGSTLTVAGYQSTGGIRGAVAQTAEKVYAEVDPTQRHLMRELMLRLVSAGTEGEASRIRAPRNRVIVEPAQERLVDDLVAARLLTSEEGVIEIAHESLARAWPRLRGWLDEDVEGQRILHHISAAADAWDALGRPDSELYRGTRLQQALEWRDLARVELTSVEEEFLDAGRRAAEAEERALVERARQQARLIRRQRIALVAGSVFLVLALAASGIAMSQNQRAQAGERAAESGERAALAGRLGARALTVDDPSLSLLLAVEAVRRDDTAQTRGFLREAMTKRPEMVASTGQTDSFLLGIAVDRKRNDGVGYGYDDVIYRFDLATGEIVATYDMDGPEVTRRPIHPPGELKRSPDGTVVAVGSQLFAKPALVLLDAETLRPRPVQLTGLPRLRAKAPGIAFSGDGRWLAASFTMIANNANDPGLADVVRQDVRVWDLTRPTERPRRIPLRVGDYSWVKLRLSEHGRTLYTIKPSVAARRVRRGGVSWRRPDLALPFGPSFDLSPNGRMLAMPAGPTGVLLLDASTGATADQLTTDGREAAGFDYSPNGSRLAISDWSGGLRVLDTTSRQVTHTFALGKVSVDYGMDEATIHVAGDHGIEAIDLEGERRFVRRTPWPLSGRYYPTFTSIGPNGAAAVRSLQSNRTGAEFLELASTKTGRRLARVRIGSAVGEVSGDWRSDGAEYVLGMLSGELVVIPVDGPVRRLRSEGDRVVAARYVGTGETLVVLEEAGRLRQLNARSATPQGAPVRLDGVPMDLALTRDGRRAVVLLAEPPSGPSELAPPTTWALVDLQRHEVVRTGPLPVSSGDFGWQRVALEPLKGDRLVLMGGLGATIVDLRTGESVGSPLALHTDFTKTGGFTADGAKVLVGGDDGRVSIWDARTGSPVDIALVHPATLPSPQILADGHTLVAATVDALYHWDTRIEKAVEAACHAAGRSMTDVEWRTNVGDDIPYHATCG